MITFYYGQDDIENKTDPLRIYEEFTFSAAGEITFVEAWWDNDYKVCHCYYTVNEHDLIPVPVVSLKTFYFSPYTRIFFLLSPLMVGLSIKPLSLGYRQRFLDLEVRRD